MGSNQLYFFKDKRFLPIFIVQFCGCLNDNILKNALIILITFKISENLSVPPYILVMLANVLFISPFVIFASLAGQIADRYERSKIVRIIKFLEIAIILLSAYGFYNENLIILFFALTVMGIHSTFFGPIKYSVLPDHLKKEELLGANGYIEAGTFISIMFGTMIGGFYNFDVNLVISVAIIMAIIGFIASFFMPASGNTNPDIKINLNIIAESISIIKYASSRNKVYLAILGISWFWFIGAAILAQIPMLTRETLGADESVASLFLVVFSIGVGVGSFLCNKILANNITTKYVFIAAIGISLFGIDLHFATRIAEITYRPEHLKSIAEFLSKLHYWRILFDLFCLSAFGGFYVVPLFAVMQYFTSPAYRSRVIAANNLINSVFMAGSTAILSLLFYMKFSIPSVILIISILNFVIALHIYKFIPNTKIIPLKFLQMIFRTVFSIFYQVEVKGIENYRKAGKRTVIIANHLSYIDPILIATYIPENIQFAINISVSKKWWVRPFLTLARTYPIDPNNPMAIKSLIEEVQKNKKIAIFPEGRISITGALMKVYEGPAMIADKSNATILPIRVDGTQFTCFSKMSNILKTSFSLRRKITITILPPEKVNPPENLNIRERRKYISQALYDIMRDMMFESSDYKQTLFQSLINSAKLFGMNRKILEDIDGNNSTYRSIFLKSFILSDLIAKQTKIGEKAGIMLPNMVGSVISFFAMQSSGRVPAIINFTSGVSNIISSCTTSEIRIIYTSLKFIEKAELEKLVNILLENGIKIIYLEDLKKYITPFLKIKSMIGSIFPQIYYEYLCQKRDDQLPAVVLFTSGTEGKPKAVVLSHRNIQSNRCQALSIIDFNTHDLAFNALPLFHSFGMTATMIMMLGGVKIFLYPSPLHYRIIPEVIYDIGATIMFGTDSFLAAYASYAHAYDFYSMRYVIAGAEKLKEATRQTWLDKFGVRILEAYGATEASPAIATNTPMYYKAGSVGRFLPKIQYFLKPVDGIHNGGRLCVKGPNIMLGYIKPENPGVIERPFVEKLGNDWYDTGDIVNVDSEGYITILGRQKRFAKIAGEMISLAAVEELIDKINSQQANNVAVSIPDNKKGEKILLFTTIKDLTRDQISKKVKENGVSELYIPSIIIVLAEIPLLASGKTNYLKISELCQEYIKTT
jgi:acyl-[acyl-carrier-protein]-phospholipid O-acyltransferase/long-chain-fatty-acid--[acyl-carrier-protein] ligase